MLTDVPGGVSDQFDTEPPDPTPADVSPETPDQEIPSQKAPSPADNYQQADPELRARFWKLVALLKISIIVLTVGTLVGLFWADYSLAARLLVPGTVVFGYACYRAYKLKGRVDAGEFEHDLDGESDDQPAGEGGSEDPDAGSDRDDLAGENA